ncbi:phage tail sheath C-terminal domain-containing protein [Chryseobacterium gambrini]|uniref:Phage tail sheath C-terminal domain-containing protein n=1 Tax=Chryseobacterium gambrini TaxID=373672 RepID=A0AAJ1R7R4_9FLAO|nr:MULTISPECIES: phage tail sheath C-terminal domain-containing protein [Chryseobacterium]MDN4014560.1 phage tail sheath C-terminal domain-containing protein [Chryseobacterium gambrini]MDN4028105.1 phage tail sheath C-terminal domain-containing protein [Chryseobacterium gambrini]QWA39820.1 phage tail sheath family protein [Chryseobacterium sp. ZHDP1]
MNYKTPGVYVEEEAKFPPSVAQVETAIPAFIGYTEGGTQNKPTRISSMLEFKELFGKAYAETFAVAFKDGAATAVQPKVSDFKMYYAMQMYFANGGGPCYIVSVDKFEYKENGVIKENKVSPAKLEAALDLLKKEDEPTLIVFPDLQGLVATDDEVATAQAFADAAEQAADAALLAITAATAAKTAADTALTQAQQAAAAAPNDVDLAAAVVKAQLAAQAAAQALIDANSDAETASDISLAAAANVTSVTNANDEQTIKTVYSLYDSALDQAESMKDRFVIMDVLGDDTTFRNKVTSTGLKYGAAYYPNLKTILTYAFKEDKVSVMGASGATTLAELKLKNSELYNQAKAAIESQKVVLAPSSTMAGVYAKVDSTSGVFKAPANTGLNYVDSPVIKISNKRQDELNVDPTSGKSINVIRSFTGKGTLVWGARTLDGNSNEWRYISVRRFFNMVEESVKKATERFVFEPNTANTWVRVQTMIENFLNQQWQDGALAGSKPEEAYYVSVGLNKTMSAQDILEGRMIVEIGMAAVRPAEFIVLRFSHKLQEA